MKFNRVKSNFVSTQDEDSKPTVSRVKETYSHSNVLIEVVTQETFLKQVWISRLIFLESTNSFWLIWTCTN